MLYDRCESGDCGRCDYCFEVMEDMDWACMNGCCACWDIGYEEDNEVDED